jgi:hypothetical protein
MAAPPGLSNFRSGTGLTLVPRYPFLAADLAAACRALDLAGLAIPAPSDFAFDGFVILPLDRGDLRGAPTDAILVLFALATSAERPLTVKFTALYFSCRWDAASLPCRGVILAECIGAVSDRGEARV